MKSCSTDHVLRNKRKEISHLYSIKKIKMIQTILRKYIHNETKIYIRTVRVSTGTSASPKTFIKIEARMGTCTRRGCVTVESGENGKTLQDYGSTSKKKTK